MNTLADFNGAERRVLRTIFSTLSNNVTQLAKATAAGAADPESDFCSSDTLFQARRFLTELLLMGRSQVVLKIIQFGRAF